MKLGILSYQLCDVATTAAYHRNKLFSEIMNLRAAILALLRNDLFLELNSLLSEINSGICKHELS